MKVLLRQLKELKEAISEAGGLTQGPSGDDLAKRSRAHLILRQDAELVACVGGQICHVHLGASLGGHGHREPALLPIIIAR